MFGTCLTWHRGSLSVVKSHTDDGRHWDKYVLAVERYVHSISHNCFVGKEQVLKNKYNQFCAETVKRDFHRKLFPDDILWRPLRKEHIVNECLPETRARHTSLKAFTRNFYNSSKLLTWISAETHYLKSWITCISLLCMLFIVCLQLLLWNQCSFLM